MAVLIPVSVLKPHKADITYGEIFQGMGQRTRALYRGHLSDG